MSSTATSFPGGTVDGAVKDPNQQRVLLQYILSQLQILQVQSGQNNSNQNSSSLLAAPAPAQFTVTGQDGDTHIDITNPQDAAPQTVVQLLQGSGIAANPSNPSLTPVQHRIQKSTEQTFTTTSLITELPLTYDTHIVDKDPNTTMFWRLQSRFDGGEYNDWQWWSDPASCGPVSVWSGLMVTKDTDLMNSPATTTDGLNALTQDGVTTNILIAAKTWNVGTEQIAYASGHVDPGGFGSYLIYTIDLKKAGGNVTYIATTDIAVLTHFDGLIYLGNILTAAGGGGTGDGGGEGPGCVATGTGILRMDGTEIAVELLKKGDVLKGVDGGPETLQEDPLPNFSAAFRFTSKDQKVLVCGAKHLLLQPDGRPQRAAEFCAPFKIMGNPGDIELAVREYVGVILVWQLKLDRTRTYCAAGYWGHNKIFLPAS